MLVQRLGESSYISNSCSPPTSINFTHGVYDVVGYSPDTQFDGYTLERGGPDSTAPARDSDICTNKPKRIPAGSYSFSIRTGNKWANVPSLDVTQIGRSDILVHAAGGAYGSIGCILVSKSSGASGTFMGGIASSRQALEEIRSAFGYTNNFKYNYGFVTIKN